MAASPFMPQAMTPGVYPVSAAVEPLPTALEDLPEPIKVGLVTQLRAPLFLEPMKVDVSLFTDDLPESMIKVSTLWDAFEDETGTGEGSSDDDGSHSSINGQASLPAEEDCFIASIEQLLEEEDFSENAAMDLATGSSHDALLAQSSQAV